MTTLRHSIPWSPSKGDYITLGDKGGDPPSGGSPIDPRVDNTQAGHENAYAWSSA